MLAADLFTLPTSLRPFAAFFRDDLAPWEWLRQIGPALGAFDFDAAAASGGGYVARSPRPTGVHVEGAVYLHPTVKLPPTATIIGPAWIGARTEIRPGAYIRGNVIVGEGCVLGNSCEFKNCVLMDHAQVPHFSYVGDSILGNGAHFGAGVICSNLRLDQKPVTVRIEDAVFETGLRKFGALVGDQAEVGCNAVLNPGSILGRRALVMPAMAFTGYLPAAMIAKTRVSVSFMPRRD